MDCYWTGLLNVLPVWMRESVNCLQNKQLQEVRLRVGKMPVFTCKDKQITLQQVIVREDLDFQGVYHGDRWASNRHLWHRRIA